MNKVIHVFAFRISLAEFLEFSFFQLPIHQSCWKTFSHVHNYNRYAAFLFSKIKVESTI